MEFWYKRSLIAWLLWPLSLLFAAISQGRRTLFALGILKSYRAPKPVLIVGNLSVGGNGKTPVVIWLVQKLQQQGVRVGIISRGYGSQAKTYPFSVNAHTDPLDGGDEPVLIAKRTQAPVVISPNRQQAIKMLLKQQDCDLIIADDGLQHYPLKRDLEIVVVDAKRGFGNGFLLPAGPLRESPQRLKTADLVIGNGGVNAYCDAQMQLVAENAVNLLTGEKRPLHSFSEAVAIAAIGHPPRFFKMLQDFGIQLKHTQSFRDHQRFDAAELNRLSAQAPLLMTEKDAVKCLDFAKENWWYVPVTTEIQALPDNPKLAMLWLKLGVLLGKELPWKN